MSNHLNQRDSRDRRGYRRSPATLPEFRRGKPNPLKGEKNPPEALTRSEYRLLLGSFKRTTPEVRDRAMVMLMYAGLKIGKVLALRRRHYEPGSLTLTVPAKKPQGEREMTLDAETRAALDEWMELRKAVRVRRSGPLFCVLIGPTEGAPITNASTIRQMLTRRGRELGIDRKISAEGLRLSGIEHRTQTQAHGRMLEQLVAVVDEVEFESRYSHAFEIWEAAVEKFGINPVHEARRIGEDCRVALESFIDIALNRHAVGAPRNAGTVTKLRALLAAVGPESETVSAYLDALVGYWGAVSDVDNRQAHVAKREAERLTREDARRAILYTLLAMAEVDSVLPVAKER